jgi:alginate O-acetyltransferase complex protein AlgI
MLFNSDIFVFLFLPAFLAAFSIVFSTYRRAINLFVVLASLLFYAYHDPSLTIVILVSIIVNFAIAQQLTRKGSDLLLPIGIALNLAYIGYFKYACFAIDTVRWIGSLEPSTCKVTLPLAISFFTFQQIAYLVDVRRKSEVAEHAPTLIDYSAFALFFPHLIAGPIARFNQLLEPIQQRAYKLNSRTLELGLFVFSIGFFRKVFIADHIALLANPVFDASKAGVLDATTAAIGIVAFSLQIYFDFCGYSEMAVGLALMIGIALPWNFERPYASVSVIDFWRRWHITLSTFLRDYLYIPLGGNRTGRYRNLLITMLLGGLWHGAAWTFVVWGLLHGLYLIANHLIRVHAQFSIPNWIGFIATNIAVTFAWIFFRAESFGSAFNLIQSLTSFGAVARPDIFVPFFNNLPFQDGLWRDVDEFTVFWTSIAVLGVASLLSTLLDTQQLLLRYGKAQSMALRGSIMLLFGGMIAIGLHLQSSSAVKFIYFDF